MKMFFEFRPLLFKAVITVLLLFAVARPSFAIENKDYADYNVDITIKFEVDGKPYTAHRLIAYRVKEAPTCFGCGGARAAYSTFGLKLESGEAILIFAPWFCGQCSLDKVFSDFKTVEGKRGSDIPMMGILDSVENPREIIVYASYEAYNAANSRIKFKSILMKNVDATEGLKTDEADEFAIYDSRRNSWKQVSWIPIAKEIWNDPKNHVVSDDLKATFQEAKKPLILSGAGGRGKYDYLGAYP